MDTKRERLDDKLLAQIEQMADCGAKAFPATAVLALCSEIRRLKIELIEICQYAEGHHDQQAPWEFLHALRIDIPSMIGQALEQRKGTDAT